MTTLHPSRAAASQPYAWRIAALAGGDALMFLLFSAIGRSTHGEAAGLDALLQVAGTAAPFLAGWLLAAPLLGAYRPAVISRVGPMLARTALAWLVAGPLGLVIRSLLLQRGISVTFALVTLATVLVMLIVWRVLFALGTSRAAARK